MKLNYLLVACIFELFSIGMLVYAQKAKIETGEMYIQTEEKGHKGEIEQFRDGTEIPSGYVLVSRGEFKTGPATVKCGERLMIEKAKEKAREIGSNAFRFYQVKEPDNFFNTCYQAKIMFFLKL